MRLLISERRLQLAIDKLFDDVTLTEYCAIGLRRMKTSQIEEKFSRKWLESALAGDFAAAWLASDLISRARIDYSNRERWCRPLWDGTPINDRHVLIRCWRGLGDAIHFIRYANLVRAKVLSLTVETPPNLIPLFRTVSGIDNLVELDSGGLQNN